MKHLKLTIDMKKLLLAAIIALAASMSAMAQEDMPVISEKGVGSFKLGTHFSKVEPALKHYFPIIREDYADMGEYRIIECCNADNELVLLLETNSYPDDDIVRNMKVFSPLLKTAEGFSMDSTASELLEAGGELDKVDQGIIIRLNGLRFWLHDEAMNGRRVDPEANPWAITTTDWIY